MPITLHLVDLRSLDRAIVLWYNVWVSEAPQQYTSDGFLAHRIPVAITSLYGQNQPLPVREDDDAEESANWSRTRDFNRIKYMSLSIATHLESVHLSYLSSPTHLMSFPSVQEATGWMVRSIDNITSHHGENIFDHYDPNIRHPLNLHELRHIPLLNDDGTEKPIYSEHGYRIQRRFGTRSRNTRPHGVLMDLRHLDDLFVSGDLFSDSTSYNVYPQAGLVTAGHFQADGLMAAFLPLLNNLNEDIQLHDNPDEDDPLAVRDSLSPPIIGMGCQGYNALMHATRGRCAQHHDAQRGLVTGALAGSWAKTPTDKQTAKSLLQKCKHRLPHLEFRQKIANNKDQPLDCSLRLENHFVIDMDRLDPRYRNGGNFLRDVILPLGIFWSHPTTLNVVKDHAILFNPQVCSLSS